MKCIRQRLLRSIRVPCGSCRRPFLSFAASFLLLAAPSEAHAQFGDSVHYHLKYAGTGTLNRTNDTRSYLLNNAFRFQVKKKRMAGNATASWVYGEQDAQLSNNDFNASVDFNRFSSNPRFYYWGLGAFETSYSLKVINRSQAGFGAAYELLNDPDGLALNLSEGFLYEYSALRISDTSEEFYSTVRNSFRLRLRFKLQPWLGFESTSFAQHSLADVSDYILRSTSSLSLKLRDWLALTTALNYNKVSRTKSENLTLSFGLTLETWL
jgi:hypothetical protein